MNEKKAITAIVIKKGVEFGNEYKATARTAQYAMIQFCFIKTGLFFERGRAKK